MTRTPLTTAGRMGNGSESQPTTDTETNDKTGNNTTDETTIKAESVEVLSPELTFRTNNGALRVVRMNGEKVTDEGTDRVYVIVDDERTATWVADGNKGGEFPASVGSFLEIESAESGSTVETIRVGSEGVEGVLATHEVGAGETVTTMIADGTTTNETTTNEIAVNEAATTTAIEITTSSGNGISS